VYDYAPGKLDWLVNQRPIEGERAGEPLVGQYARTNLVTCALDDLVGPLRGRVASSPYPFALVLGPAGVLLGKLRAATLDCDPALRAERVMEPGPKTYRPHRTAAGVAQDLTERGLRWAIVTTPRGVFIGVAAREELEAAVKAEPATGAH
jgi:hypothetical protein